MHDQNILQGLTNEAERETTSNHNHNHNIKQHQATLKRLMDNNESEATSPKRPNINDKTTDEAMIIDDIALSPGWNKKFLSTVTSPIKENQLDKIKQIINQKIKPTTPTRRRTRSQEQKETPTKTDQNHKNSRTQSQDTKDKPINGEQIIGLIENQHNQGKANLKGPQQTKQNHNARVPRTNKPINKGRNPKPNTDSKNKDINKEQKQEDKNEKENDTTLNIVTSTPT